jgi:hypothetical protein
LNTLWESWRSELEALPALAEEWTEGAADEFVRNLQGLVAQKRALRDSALKLAHELKYVHVFYEDLLAFFDIEPAFLRWSITNCPSGDVEQARLVVAEWREVLQKYSGTFPPPGEKRLSYAAMQVLLNEAQSAAAMILAGFRSLDAYLAPRSVKPAELQTAATDKMVSTMAA